MRFPLPLAVAFALGSLAACRDHPDGLLSPSAERVVQEQAVAPPAPLVEIPVGSGTSQIWPYLTDNLFTPQDPVNLVFTGVADPRAIRNALLRLDGDRAAVFPPVFPFTCTWSDAIGGLMAGYGEDAGWGGTAVQLQCGEYGPIRFHLRLVKLGGFTIGNVHFEVVIPGTTDHQVLSWELAEQLVTYDMVRTGLLGAAPADAGGINAAPTHRSIPAVIYNGLPADLRTLIGGPPGNVASDVGIATNGHATSFLLAGAAPETTPVAEQHFVIDFNQVIPNPFCATGPTDFLLVQGPISLDQEVSTLPTGQLRKVFRAAADLTAIPFDIFTGLPAGTPLRVHVSEHQESRADDQGGDVQGTQHQQLLPRSGPGTGQLLVSINVTPGKTPKFDRKVTCQ
jgi:hypothetical protein